MTRMLDQPVDVRLGGDGRPATFRWRGRWHRVAEVIEEWVYRRPWWETAGSPAQPEERTFYRVLDASGGMFELALDPSGGARLHRIFD